MRRTSVSTIGWTESIMEFEGGLGSVHVSGERRLPDVDPDLQLHLQPSPPTPAGIRRSSWSIDAAGALDEISNPGADARRGTAPEAASAGDVHPSPAPHATRVVVVGGHWEAALRTMREFEMDAQSRSKIGVSSSSTSWRSASSRARTWSKGTSSRESGTGNTCACVNGSPEGPVDQELRDVCRMVVMNRRRRAARASSAGDLTYVRHPFVC